MKNTETPMDLPLFSHRSRIDFNPYFELKETDGLLLSVVELGEYPLSSGELVLADPLSPGIQAGMKGVRIDRGNCQHLQLCLASGDQGESPALLRWRFGEQQAMEWFLAVASDVPAEDLFGLQENEFIGTESGSGWVMLADAAEYEGFLLKYSPLMGTSPQGHLKESLAAQGEAVAIDLKGQEDKPLLCVNTGWKGGVIPAYWGLNEQKKVVEIVVDFLLLGME